MLKNNKRILSLLCVAVMSASIFVGCASNTNKNKEAQTSTQEQTQKEDSKEYANKDYIVDAQWVKDNLDNKDVVIVDCRDPKAYSKGHIKNAINITWQDLSNMNGTAEDKTFATVLKPEELSKKLSGYGLSKDKTIVLYSVKDGWGEDGRVQWNLKYAGLDNVKMLNGGYNVWEEKEYETSKDEVKPTAADIKVDKFNEDLNITTDQLKEKLGKVKIIDTRAKDEFEGATKYGEVRGGHIPGAINIEFNQLYKEDGTLKSQTEIEKIMTDNGINKEDEIVTYCTSGIRSGHMVMVLKLAGYDNVKNYDESYVAWAATPELEVEK